MAPWTAASVSSENLLEREIWASPQTCRLRRSAFTGRLGSPGNHWIKRNLRDVQSHAKHGVYLDAGESDQLFKKNYDALRGMCLLTRGDIKQFLSLFEM